MLLYLSCICIIHIYLFAHSRLLYQHFCARQSWPFKWHSILIDKHQLWSKCPQSPFYLNISSQIKFPNDYDECCKYVDDCLDNKCIAYFCVLSHDFIMWKKVIYNALSNKWLFKVDYIMLKLQIIKSLCIFKLCDSFWTTLILFLVFFESIEKNMSDNLL